MHNQNIFSLEQSLVTTLTKKINIITYFENLIVKLHVFYILKHISNFILVEYYLPFDP